MHVANELSESDARLEMLHVAVRRSDRRRVDKHQIHAGDEQNQKQHRGNETKAKRVAHAQHALRDLDGIEMQKEIAERLQRSPAWRVKLRVAKD